MSMTSRASIGMLQVNAVNLKAESVAEKLAGLKILLVAPSLGIMGGQAVQADLLRRNFQAEGAQVDLLPINPVPWGPLKYLTRIKYVRTLVVSIFYIASLLLRVHRYDVIHIFSASYFSFIIAPTPALLISKLYGKKTILNYRSGEAEDHFQRSGWIVFRIMKLVDMIVVPSGYLVDVFAKFNHKAFSIFNISDFSQFKYRSRDQVRPRIIVARNLEALYDVATSVKAFAQVQGKIPDATLVIVGVGSEEKHLRRLVDELKLTKVTFTGRVERDRIAALFDDADVFLNSSVIDNMPVAIIEAFYAGLPVVTTNAGGIPYFVKDDVNGLVVEMRDDAALAGSVIRILEDSDIRDRLIAAGRETARQCSWDAVKMQWAETYCSVAGHDE